MPEIDRPVTDAEEREIMFVQDMLQIATRYGYAHDGVHSTPQGVILFLCWKPESTDAST